MKKCRLLVVVVALCSVSAQLFAVDLSLRAGGSMLLYDKRYYPELFGDKSPMIPDLNFKVGWTDNSESIYADLCKHPQFGVAVGADLVGVAKAKNGPGVGNLYSLYGYFDRPWFHAKGFSLGYTAGWGLGFCFNNLSDPVTNPWNIMISYPVMWHASLGLQAQYTINEKHVIGLGFYFNHYSNGAFNYQNKGFNGFELALSYGINDVANSGKKPSVVYRDSTATLAPPTTNSDTKVRQKTSRDKARGLAKYGEDFRRGFQFDVQFSAGAMAVENHFDNTELRTGRGENVRRFKCSIQADCLYKYCKTQASGIGIDVFFTPFCDMIAEDYVGYKSQQAANNGEVYDKQYMSHKVATRADLKDPNKVIYQPVSVGISFVHEFCYRNLTTSVLVGYYLFDNDGLAPNKKLYQAVSLKYHFPKLVDTYAGIVLKAHKFMAAESVQFCIGKRF